MTTTSVGTGTLRLKLTLDSYALTGDRSRRADTLHDVQLRLEAVAALLECTSLIYNESGLGSQELDVRTRSREPAGTLIAPGAAVIDSITLRSPLVVTLAALPAPIVYGVMKIVDRINLTRQRHAETNATVATAQAVEEEQQLRHDVFALLREQLGSQQPELASSSNPVIERTIRHLLTETARRAPRIVAAEVLEPDEE